MKGRRRVEQKGGRSSYRPKVSWFLSREVMYNAFPTWERLYSRWKKYTVYSSSLFFKRWSRKRGKIFRFSLAKKPLFLWAISIDSIFKCLKYSQIFSIFVETIVFNSFFDSSTPEIPLFNWNSNARGGNFRYEERELSLLWTRRITASHTWRSRWLVHFYFKRPSTGSAKLRWSTIAMKKLEQSYKRPRPGFLEWVGYYGGEGKRERECDSCKSRSGWGGEVNVSV